MSLKNIDVVLGFAAVMLVLSLIITTLVQLLVNVLSLRGYNLVRGVARLFQQLDPAFTKQISDELSGKLLKHPAVSRSLGRVTEAITKDEFVQLANDLSTNHATLLTQGARDALQQYLQKMVGNPPLGQQAAAAAVGGVVQAAANVAGNVQKISKDVEQWFDMVLDRTSDTFTLHTRLITAAVALVLAIGLRVDSLNLFRQLSSNDDARNRLVASAQATADQAKQMLGRVQPPAAGAAPTQAEATAALNQNVTDLKQLTGVLNDFKKSSLEIIPADPNNTDWRGILMTAIFLSLGAPFWFNALQELSSLRPAIAQAVDQKSAATATPGGNRA